MLQACDELHRIITDREMKDAIILVFANKQDLKGALTPEEIPDRLKLNEIHDRNWCVRLWRPDGGSAMAPPCDGGAEAHACLSPMPAERAAPGG